MTTKPLQISFQDDMEGRGWNAWNPNDSAPADPIPGTRHLGEDDFDAAKAAAVAAWGAHWSDAQEGEWVSA